MASSGLGIQAAGKIAQRVPVLRALPVVELLMWGEVAILAKQHLERLTQPERRRLVELVKQAKGRPKNLSVSERDELSALVQKAEPRMFLADCAEKLSPVGVPEAVSRRIGGR
ncbi:MAG: hypothetical protein J2O48_12065 [Solirubrobacterales bacterium]|nr:hypothetical protein [Solirubrobacterales bacterium]